MVTAVGGGFFRPSFRMSGVREERKPLTNLFIYLGLLFSGFLTIAFIWLLFRK